MRRLVWGALGLALLIAALSPSAQAACLTGRPTAVSVGLGPTHGVYGWYWQECFGFEVWTDYSVESDISDPLAPSAGAYVDLPRVLARYHVHLDLVFGSIVVPLYHGVIDASSPACVGAAAGADMSGSGTVEPSCGPFS